MTYRPDDAPNTTGPTAARSSTPTATVSVRGEATILTAPELAALSLTIEAHGADSGSALELLGERAASVADLVARLSNGIERSETTRLQVYPELGGKKVEKVRRYVGRTTTSLLVHDFGVLSDLVAGAGAIELVSVAGPWWQLRPGSDVYRQARLAAARDALARARDYAAAFGVELVGLVEIADQGMSHADGVLQARSSHAFRAHGAGGGEAAFDLEPAQQQVTGQLEARFLITQPDFSGAVPERPA